MQKIFKKFFILSAIIFSISFFASIISPNPTFAADGNYIPSSDCDALFLDLVPWNCNVTITDENSLKSGIWMIASNVATDIAKIAIYLVIGFIIYGGYLYIFSGGEPTKVATGKKALNQAFIGFAITMSAFIILNVIRIVLISDKNLASCIDNECVSPAAMITSMIQWVVGMAGVVCLIFVVGGGIYYATSSGDPNKLQKAKNMILYALIGLAIVALVEVIAIFIRNTIVDATKNVPGNYTASNNLKQATINHLTSSDISSIIISKDSNEIIKYI